MSERSHENKSFCDVKLQQDKKDNNTHRKENVEIQLLRSIWIIKVFPGIILFSFLPHTTRYNKFIIVYISFHVWATLCFAFSEVEWSSTVCRIFLAVWVSSTKTAARILAYLRWSYIEILIIKKKEILTKIGQVETILFSKIVPLFFFFVFFIEKYFRGVKILNYLLHLEAKWLHASLYIVRQ